MGGIDFNPTTYEQLAIIPYHKIDRNIKILQLKYPMEQHALKNVNNCFKTSIYLETSGGQSSNLYLNVGHFFQHQC